MATQTIATTAGPRGLSFDANAHANLEEAIGATTAELVTRLQEAPGFALVRRALWIGLRSHEPSATIEHAGEVIDDVGLPAAAAIVVDALTGAGGDTEPVMVPEAATISAPAPEDVGLRPPPTAPPSPLQQAEAAPPTGGRRPRRPTPISISESAPEG